MKVFTVQMEDDFYASLFDGAKAADSSASKFVRDAIREKLARDAVAVDPVAPVRSASRVPLESMMFDRRPGEGLREFMERKQRENGATA